MKPRKNFPRRTWRVVLAVCLSLICLPALFFAAENVSPRVRFIRAYGDGDERKPPILILGGSASSRYNEAIGSRSIVFEFDVSASVPPALFARFVHCSANWEESENSFLENIVSNRTSAIRWSSAPLLSKYYNYRGTLKVPNGQVKFEYSGNWKMKLYDYDNPERAIAEVKFFVVIPKARCEAVVIGDFYKPDYSFVSPSGKIAEARVYSRENLIDDRIFAVVFYNNHRWNEPIAASLEPEIEKMNEVWKYKPTVYVSGFASMGKIFRVEGLPMENEYRVLDLSSTTRYPLGAGAVRKPLSDYRRTGSYSERDDDGAMITSSVADFEDEYANFEFVLNPDGWISLRDVYVVGSFNGWTPSAKWQMSYDAKSGKYRLRNFVKRARHNYMYATGDYDVETGKVERIAYDEYEGNASSSSHTLYAFVYYRSLEYGGYDEIIAAVAISPSINIRR